MIIEKKCIPLADNSESKVFWLKLIGDFYRYEAESVLFDKETGLEDGTTHKSQIH